MKKLIKTLALALATIVASLVVLAPVASASSLFPGSDICKQAQQNSGSKKQPSAVCSTPDQKSDPLTGSGGIIAKVTLIIATVAGIAAVVMIIVAGLQFIFSGGEAQKTATARNTILYAIIGLIVIALASAIITFVVSKL